MNIQLLGTVIADGILERLLPIMYFSGVVTWTDKIGAGVFCFLWIGHCLCRCGNE